jgi:hypothetical protein
MLWCQGEGYDGGVGEDKKSLRDGSYWELRAGRTFFAKGIREFFIITTSASPRYRHHKSSDWCQWSELLVIWGHKRGANDNSMKDNYVAGFRRICSTDIECVLARFEKQPSLVVSLQDSPCIGILLFKVSDGSSRPRALLLSISEDPYPGCSLLDRFIKEY